MWHSISHPPPHTHTHTLGDWKDNVVHMVIISLFIQTGICFALNLCVSERRHFDMLFTSEVQKHDGSWRNWHFCRTFRPCSWPHFSHSPFQFRWTNLSCARRKLKGFGYRSFSVLAPLVWNNLPAHIPHCSSLSQFRTSLVWNLSLYFCRLWATLTLSLALHVVPEVFFFIK